MHVCRPKIGDGTLLTSIWNLNDGKVHLYFYHDYHHSVTFHLNDELKKGNHLLSIDDLFPKNAEFEKLGAYKTTKNTLWLMFSMMAFSFILFCSAIYFLISFMRNKDQNNYVKILLSMSGFLVSYYVYVLCTHQNIFYFPAPYEDKFNKAVSMSAYIPNLIALFILPFTYLNFYVFKSKSWSMVARNLFLVNNLVYVILLCFFVYWHLFWL
jgi:hypothetical protein